MGLDHGGDAEAVAARLVAWLGGTSRPWLVVLDDLRDAADLESLWPSGPTGRVLITAADAAVVSCAPRVLIHAVPKFSTREALSYLAGRLTTDPDQRSGAIDLAASLGCEPVALAQAAAVIISSGIRCREYRDYFVQRPAQLAAGGNEPTTAAWFTWTVAASHAERLAPGAGTWRLLVLTAFLDGNGIPASVLTASAVCRYLADQAETGQPDLGRAWSALLVLERAGLVTLDTAGAEPTAWVSPALQEAVRSVAPPELLARAVQSAADALAEIWPADQLRSWQAAGQGPAD